MEKTYYQLYIDEINNLKEKKTILLHSCCAPCGSHVITCLAPFFNITILYYNPNIYPKEEYLKRKEEQIKLIKEIDIPTKIDFIDCDYDNEIYESSIKGYEDCKERGARCNICFELRLDKTAKTAKEHNFDYFCSTLTVSPYKSSNLINQIGEKLSKKYDIKWLYSDFKKENGYKDSIELSKKYNLYRQDYCGCIYSKKERENIKKNKEI